MNSFLRIGIGIVTAGILAIAASSAAAQRGVGGDEGVARMPQRPETVTLEGSIAAINVGPCERTTGRARVGVHLLVEPAASAPTTTDDVADSTIDATVEPWNIHVGPQSAAQETLAKFPLGTQVTIEAFRTDKMPANHYVARKVMSENATVTLRDETLRPVWAGSGGPAASDRTATPAGPRYGRGQGGRGRGYGMGRGRGFGGNDWPGPQWHGRRAW